MKLNLLFVLILTSCNFHNDSNDSWRKYFASEKMLENGYVKKTVLHSDHGDLTYYDKVYLENDTIILERYDENFSIVRRDLNTFNSERMELVSQTLFYDNLNPVPVQIIEPTIAPYKPTNEILITNLEYNPNDHITISIKTKAKYMSVETYNFNGEELDCLKFSFDEEFSLMNSVNPSENILNKSNGYTLWGKDIGLVYMKFNELGGISEYKLSEILTVSEFDSLKL